MSRRYPAHPLMTDPAQPSRALWRLAVGVVVAALVMIALTRGLLTALPAEVAQMIDQTDRPGGALLLLGLMGAMGVSTMVAAELVHRRRAGSLFGPGALFWQQFLRVTGALALVHLVIFVLPPDPFALSAGYETTPGLSGGLWLTLLPLTVGVLLVQTGSEELFFRGYLQSQLAARCATPWVWMALPSALFALGHYAPESYGENAGLVALWSFVFGLAAADLTARAGTLGPAMAFHLVNNFVAIGLVSLEGELSGLARRILPISTTDTEAMATLLPLDLAGIGVSWLAARLALRR